MSDNKRPILNDHKPTNLVRQPTGDIVNNHKQTTNVRPPEPTTPVQPSNSEGGKK